MQIEDFIDKDERLSETPMNRAPNDALEKSTYPQEGEEDLKNSSGDDEEDKPHYASAKMPGPGMSFHISITLLHDYILM